MDDMDRRLEEAMVSLAHAWAGTRSARMLTAVVGGGIEYLRYHREKEQGKVATLRAACEAAMSEHVSRFGVCGCAICCALASALEATKS